MDKSGRGKGELHRLFVAVDLPEHVKDALTALCTGVPGAKWVRRTQIHLTLRFIGEVDSERFEAVKAALAQVETQPFTLALRGVGRFPPGKKPARVLWVGVEAGPELETLYHKVEDTIRGLDFAPDDHEFSPHITLARLKTPAPPGMVEQFLARHDEFETEPIVVEAFYLYSSVLAPNGPIYRREATYTLAQDAR